MRMPCEFFLLRYVPDVVKGEFVNIGVLLREAAETRAGRGRGDAWAQVRFTRDWSRVRCIDAEADIALLEGLEQEIGARLSSERSGAVPYRDVVSLLQETLSNSVQMSEARASLAENMTAELEQLMRMYVEPIGRPRVRAVKSGRALLQGRLRTEFERAGVWAAMRKRIAAAPYTRPGDPLRLDCGYRAEAATKADPDAIIRIFQAVSLEGEIEAARVLAFAAPQLREGVRRVEAARLELTAVVEPLRTVSEEEDEARERYRFGVDAMEQQDIRVITLNDLARAAETARRELGV